AGDGDARAGGVDDEAADVVVGGGRPAGHRTVARVVGGKAGAGLTARRVERAAGVDGVAGRGQRVRDAVRGGGEARDQVAGGDVEGRDVPAGLAVDGGEVTTHVDPR